MFDIIKNKKKKIKLNRKQKINLLKQEVEQNELIKSIKNENASFSSELSY